MICPICNQSLLKTRYPLSFSSINYICPDHVDIDINKSTNQCVVYLIRGYNKQLQGHKVSNYTWLLDLSNGKFDFRSNFIPLTTETLLSDPLLLFNRLLKLTPFL